MAENAGAKPRHSEKRQRQAVANVRLLPDEAALLRERAAERGITISEVLRRALLRELHSA